MSGRYSTNPTIWLVPRAGSILPIRPAHSGRYPILCVMILHQLRRCNFSFTYRVNFSLFTVNINFGVDSNHSESVFYYPDEVEKFSDKENIGSQRKENQQKAQFTMASVQKKTRWKKQNTTYTFGKDSFLTPDQVVRVRALAPGVIVLCSWARHFTLTVLLFTQVYKWVPANVLGVTPQRTSIHPGGSSNTPSRFMLRKPESSTGPMGHLGSYKGSLLLLFT